MKMSLFGNLFPWIMILVMALNTIFFGADYSFLEGIVAVVGVILVMEVSTIRCGLE